MDKTTALDNIILLPRQFYTLGNFSIFYLLKQSGYFELHDQINNGDILKAVTYHRDVVKDWLTWSENKRTEGWFLKKNDDETYIVGYVPFDKSKKQIEFANADEACSYFIQNEIEVIRNC